MQRKERREMKIKMKIKLGVQEQAPSVVHARDTNIPLILGVKGERK